jgi:hypothetical protein
MCVCVRARVFLLLRLVCFCAGQSLEETFLIRNLGKQNNVSLHLDMGGSRVVVGGFGFKATG